ncbi:hypothetical protein HanPSC8_Chr06g0244261 [Helianthus annuus]|nr:hypothetical protein HanPSC8_Chr06g0244261 [Helianthus annuus]
MLIINKEVFKLTTAPESSSLSKLPSVTASRSTMGSIISPPRPSTVFRSCKEVSSIYESADLKLYCCTGTLAPIYLFTYNFPQTKTLEIKNPKHTTCVIEFGSSTCSGLNLDQASGC